MSVLSSASAPLLVSPSQLEGKMQREKMNIKAARDAQWKPAWAGADARRK